jgi:hypothetical protein
MVNVAGAARCFLNPAGNFGQETFTGKEKFLNVLRILEYRMRNIPSLAALSAFEAAARLGGVARAAEELNVSTSAVSHHLSDRATA